jgi:glycosyltransferase involved in cell wall biosynthesis
MEVDTRGWQLPDYEVTEFAVRATRYCVVIPVLNEGERIRAELEEIARCGISRVLDIVILDGGSSDGSIEPSFLRHTGVRALLVKTGPGRLSAQLRMGYAWAMQEGYEGVVTIDGNNKDGVDAIAAFIPELESGWDFVQGSRFIPGGKAINTPWIRRLAIRMVHAPLLSLSAGFRYTDTTNGFRAYSRRLLLDPRVRPFRNVFATYELLAYLSMRAPRTGHHTKEIAVTRRYPAAGVPTKISFLKGNLNLLLILFKVVLGRFNPEASV